MVTDNNEEFNLQYYLDNFEKTSGIKIADDDYEAKNVVVKKMYEQGDRDWETIIFPYN